jgi:hypothetical protein
MRRQNRIPFDRHPLAMLLGAIVVVGVLAAIFVVGSGGVFRFLFRVLITVYRAEVEKAATRTPVT